MPTPSIGAVARLFLLGSLDQDSIFPGSLFVDKVLYLDNTCKRTKRDGEGRGVWCITKTNINIVIIHGFAGKVIS